MPAELERICTKGFEDETAFIAAQFWENPMRQHVENDVHLVMHSGNRFGRARAILLKQVLQLTFLVC